MFFKAKSKSTERPAMNLEGVLGPNSRLDDAPSMAVDAPNALCVAPDSQLLFSSGNTVFKLKEWGAKPKLWAEFGSPVSALCASPQGLVAIGGDDEGIVVRDGAGQPQDGWAQPDDLATISDCMFLSEDEIVIVDNGYSDSEDVLSIAPWDDVTRGQVVTITRSGSPRRVAGDLHCPMGVSRSASGDLLVTLLERACVISLSGKVRQSGYPAYLGRLRKTATGYVMACLSRRDPLIEFLKTEKEFVAEMKATIAPRHWISPRAKPEFSHDFPIELGATRLYGEIKPWAPSFSYGLIIELDENLMPIASAHSRANGLRHEITDVVSWKGALIGVSRASGELLRVGSKGQDL